MAIEKKPFVNYTLDSDKKQEKRKIYPVSFNMQEQEILQEASAIIEQDQPSKAIKQIFLIGCANVIHDKKTRLILETLFKNKRNNARRGVVDFE